MSVPTDAMSCGRCLNGGQAYLPNSIFGVCKCRCASPFKGPACQFHKRSGPPSPPEVFDEEEDENVPEHDSTSTELRKFSDQDLNSLLTNDSNLARILSSLRKHLKPDFKENHIEDSDLDEYLKQRQQNSKGWKYHS